jgi:hypothetical protein
MRAALVPRAASHVVPRPSGGTDDVDTLELGRAVDEFVAATSFPPEPLSPCDAAQKAESSPLSACMSASEANALPLTPRPRSWCRRPLSVT